MVKGTTDKLRFRSLAKSPVLLLFGLLTLVAALFALSTVASAAGGTIEVVSNQTKVKFPGDVVLSLEAQAGADIVEVRLYYRVAPSGVWTYTYPELIPSRRVETNFILDIAGAAFLTPGTELEYYYSIRDALGNSLTTDAGTFFYVDQRYRWQTTEAGPLAIYWHDQSSGRAEDVAREVERSLSEIAAILEVELGDPMRGVIYNSQSEAAHVFPFQSNTTTEQQVFQGLAFPERRTFVGVGLQTGLIVHESAHILLDDAMQSPGARLPAWVNEGFASHVESRNSGFSRGFSRATNPEVMPLRQMTVVSGTPATIRYFYRKAESVVGYLLATRGVEDFRAFLRELGDGKTSDAALKSAYGFGVNDLDQRWAAAVSGQEHEEDAPAGGGGGRSFVGLGTVLIGVLVLVASAAAASGYLLRKMRRRLEGPEEFDGLTKEEWENRP